MRSRSFLLLFLLSFICTLSHAVSTQKVSTKHNISVATDEWPPFRIISKEGDFSGFDIDLLEAISEITDLQFDVKRTPWTRALKQLEHNQVNLITGVAYTKERAEYINYVAFPYFTCRPAFYMQKSLLKEINSYQALYQYKIGYVFNSAYFEPFDSDPKINRHGVATEAQLLKMAEKGRLSVFVGTDCQVDYEITKLGLWDKLTKVNYQPEQSVKLYLGLSMQQDVPGLVTKLGNALIELDKSGKLFTIKKKYFSHGSKKVYH